MSMNARRKQQYLIFGLLLVISLAGLYFISRLMDNSQATFVARGFGETGSVDETLIADRTSAASPEMSWIQSSQKQIEKLTKDIETIRREAKEQALADAGERQRILDETGETVVAQQAKINALEAALKKAQQKPVQNNASQNANTGNLRTAALDQGFGGDFISQSGNRRAAAQGLPQHRSVTGLPSNNNPGAGLTNDALGGQPVMGVSFALEPKPETANAGAAGGAVTRKNLGSYLPAGSYAPATVISGVDASTGVVSQDNPVPVTLRVTGPATTAGQGTIHGRRVDITGCMVLGSARGDLSSERVYVRLIKLTCLNGDEVLEANIAGYMSGSGKAGVRGKVVSREGNLTTNAAVAGALQGLANGLSGAGQSVADAENAGLKDVLRAAGLASVSEGTATAAQTLSEYYIKRAEQYQPVVSLYGGSKVEIVFIEGVDFSEGGS